MEKGERDSKGLTKESEVSVNLYYFFNDLKDIKRKKERKREREIEKE